LLSPQHSLKERQIELDYLIFLNGIIFLIITFSGTRFTKIGLHKKILFINFTNYAMFNIKIPINLFLVLAMFLSFFKTEAQNFTNQGEGKVIIEEFLTIDPSPDLSKPYRTSTLYIKNFKILREEPKVIESPKEQINLDSLSHSTPIYDENGNDGGSVSSSMTVGVRKTKYLLDLKTKTAFIIGHKNGKTYYYKQDLVDFQEDLYQLFFNIFQKFGKYNDKLELTNNSKYIDGYLCEEALFYFSQNKKIKGNLWVTRNKWSVKTPLDNMLAEASPFSLYFAIFPTGGKEETEGYFTVRVKEIKEQKIPDEKFEIPLDAILLTKTEWDNFQFSN
jgi:hypothetical protein